MFFQNNRLLIKTFKILFLAIISFTFSFFIYIFYTQKKDIETNLSYEVQNMVKMLIYISSKAIILNDGYYIVDYTNKFLQENENIQSIIFSKLDGKNYVIKQASWTYEDKFDNVYKSLEKKQPVYKIIYSPILNKRVFHYVYPIVFSGTNWGWLHISLSLDKYNNLVSNMYKNFFIFFAIICLISLFVSYIIARIFSKPIIELNRVTKKVSLGQLSQRTNYVSDDEIGELSSSFNNMIEKIEKTQNNLEQSNEKLKDEMKKRLEQEALLIQQSRLAAMGDMIGNIAHQWRQPLSVITTAASGIKIENELGLKDNELSQDKKLDGIIKNANYLSKTIDDFRNFFKENKKKDLFLVNEKIDETLSLVKDSFDYYYIKVTKEYKTDEKVFTMQSEYSQVMLNILSNAKDAIIEKKIENPHIYITSYEKDNNVCVDIEDNAGGIDEKIMTKIFDPYFTTKHQSQGTGVGLYMSKVIIEQNMHGKLEVKNSENGALFTISLPKNQRVSTYYDI